MKSNPTSDENLKTLSIPSFKDFNLKELLLKYFRYWYWFVLCFIVFTVFAYVLLRYSVPQYDVSSTILISQEDNLSDAGLSVKLNIQYFYEGRVLEIEEYENPIVRINFLVSDSVLYQKSGAFNVRVNSETSFSFMDSDGNELNTHDFGNSVPTSVGEAVLTPNQKNISGFKGKIIKIKLLPVRSLVASYRERLNINKVGQNSSVLQISLRDGVIHKAEDFVNNLVDAYNIRTIDNKKETSNKTAQFINDRLTDISEDLSNVDNQAAEYMSQYGITEDVAGSTGRLVDISTENKREITIYETQTLLIQSTIDFIKNKEAKNEVIPSNLGIDDSSISTDIGKYNTLVLQRKKLLKTSTVKNPVVVKIDDQLAGLREVLFQSLVSLQDKVAIKLRSVQSRENGFQSKELLIELHQQALCQYLRIKKALIFYLQY